MQQKQPYIKIYHGFGFSNQLTIFGHVFKKEPRLFTNYSNHFFSNIRQLFRLFQVRTVPYAKVVMEYCGILFHGTAAADGFFRFDWEMDGEQPPGWHPVTVYYLNETGARVSAGTGKIFVPYPSQYILISDIDDTVMRSYSATVFKRVLELIAHNPRQRKIFKGTVAFYDFLANIQADQSIPNPFFYVSSSEWNLYDYLKVVFRHNHLPEGIFLLNQMKTLKDLLKSGQTQHSGKLTRISRIVSSFPTRKFILLGDNSQQDPILYQAIASKYTEKIHAVFIRNVRESRAAATERILSGLRDKGVHTKLFHDSKDAMAFAESLFH